MSAESEDDARKAGDGAKAAHDVAARAITARFLNEEYMATYFFFKDIVEIAISNSCAKTQVGEPCVTVGMTVVVSR